MALNDRQLTTAPPQDAVLIAPMNDLDGGDDFFQSFRGRSGLKHFMRIRQTEAEALLILAHDGLHTAPQQ